MLGDHNVIYRGLFHRCCKHSSSTVLVLQACNGGLKQIVGSASRSAFPELTEDKDGRVVDDKFGRFGLAIVPATGVEEEVPHSQ